MRKPELLLPGGSLDVLKVAVLYGADAVYIGGESFGLRAKAKNFSRAEMEEGIAFAHEHGAKVYVTANIFAHDADLEGAAAYFRELSEIGPELHISTQANNTNYETCLFWHELGAKRIVTARELSLREIKDIREHIPDELEIESFVHGAMCISYSGRCLLSSYLAGRDANRGLCTHPCRWKYAVMEETRPGEYMPIEENERGTFIFNSKDLCMIEHLPDLYEAGIDSFKIEGRMKTALYVATAARTYRLAMDAYERDPKEYEEKLPWFREQIADCTYRKFTTGFFYGRPDQEDQIYDNNTYVNNYTFLGIVREIDGNGDAVTEQKNKFCVGDTIEIMKPDGRNVVTKVLALHDGEGQPMDSAPHPKQELHIRLEAEAEPWDILRRAN